MCTVLQLENTFGETDMETGSDRKLDSKLIKTQMNLSFKNQRSVKIKKKIGCLM